MWMWITRDYLNMNMNATFDLNEYSGAATNGYLKE